MPNPNANKLVSLSQGELEFAMGAPKAELEAKIAHLENQLSTLQIIQKARKFPGGAPKKISATKAGTGSTVSTTPASKAAEVIDLNDPLIQAEIASGVRGPNGKKRRADFGKPKGPRAPRGSKNQASTATPEQRSTGAEVAGSVAEQAITTQAPVEQVAEAVEDGGDLFNDDHVISTQENPLADDDGRLVPYGQTRAMVRQRVAQAQQGQAQVANG